MPQQRICMKIIRDVLRHYHGDRCSKRQIAVHLGLSRGTVRNYLRRAAEAGVFWPLPEGLTDKELEALLFPAKEFPSERPQPDWAAVHKQLSRTGMTLERSWHAYRQAHPDGYSYGHFCERYKNWSQKHKVTMRLHHKAGEQLFVDYAGDTIEITDPETGEVRKAQIFVATLGCSNYTYVEATPDQKIRSWIGAHVRAMAFFGAVPAIVVCDNLKAAVVRADRKSPQIQRTYLDFARHYNTRISPARAKKPQDKSLVELAVKFATSRILTALKPRQFFSIAELNEAIAPLLEQLNEVPFQKKTGTRRSQFEELDRPAMRPLPETPYEFREWKKLKVNIDYHVQANFAYYSVPYRLVGKKMDVCIGENLVKCFYKHELVATHPRIKAKGGFSTHPNHMPERHRRYRDRERLLERARAVGPETERLAQQLLGRRSHQEQNFRAILGILGLLDRFGAERLESACRLALSLGPRAHNYPTVSSILQKERDFLFEPAPCTPQILHDNLRGGDYYAAKPKKSSNNATSSNV